MSLALLSQLFDETRRLAIAGSVVAPGDFRLKKLAPQLAQVGQKAPVFAKLGEAAKAVVESDEHTAAPMLLNLSTLINAVLYTQGETGLDGPLEPIATIDFGSVETQASARMLKPLLEALTSKGSGRLELITEAQERGAFRDLRLIQPALAALDDVYPEIAAFVAENVLPQYGRTILPTLLADLDLKGKGGAVRRMNLIARLDPEGSRPLFLKALEEGSADMRVAAIEALGTSPEDLPLLLEQARAKAQAVRKAAMTGLARSTEPEAIELLHKALEGKDYSMALHAARQTRNPAVVALIIEQIRTSLDELLAGTITDTKIGNSTSQRVQEFLNSLHQNLSDPVEALLLQIWRQRAELARIKGPPANESLLDEVATLMANGTPKVRQELAASHADALPRYFDSVVLAAQAVLTPADFYTQFSPYLRLAPKTKARSNEAAKKEVLIAVLSHRTSRHSNPYYSYGNIKQEPRQALDSRWLDVAVELELCELSQALPRTGHQGLNNLLLKQWQAIYKKSSNFYESMPIFSTMIDVNHPETTAIMLMMLNDLKGKTRLPNLYGIGNCLIQFPTAAAPQFEAAIAELPETHQKQLNPFLDELKAKENQAETAP